MPPSEHLNNNRKLGLQRKIADDDRKRRQQRAAFFAGSTDDQYLSTGGADIGGLVQREQNADVGQVRSLHRTEPQEAIAPIFADYPFKTLLLTTNKKLWLGGDRFPQQVAIAAQAPIYFGLINSGGKTGWQSSYLDASTNPYKLKFQTSVVSSELTLRYGSSVAPCGQNIWMDINPCFPSTTTETRITLSGNPPSEFVFENDPNPESGGTNSFSVRYPYTARIVGATWPPYSSTPLPIGYIDWTQSSLYDGAAPTNYPRYLSFTSFDFTETRAGRIAFPVRVFRYDFSLQDPVSGYEGTNIQNQDFSKTLTMNRSADFSSIEIAQNYQSITQRTTTVEIPFIGDQKRSYLSRNNSSETYTLVDNRSTGGTGATISWNASKTTTTDNTVTNPLNRVMFGQKCCFITERISGQTQTVTVAEVKSASGGVETIGFNPNMRSQNLSNSLSSIYGGVTQYLVSAGGVSQGSNGGWYAAGSGVGPGEPAPSPNVYRYGEALPGNTYPINPEDPGFPIPLSLLWSAFDAEGAYQDNFTWPERGVYSRYTTSVAPKIIGGVDQAISNWTQGSNDAPPTQSGSAGPVTTKRFGRNYRSEIVTRTITDYPAPFRHFLLTETKTYEIAAQQSYIYNGIPSSYVVSPPAVGSGGTLTIANSAAFTTPIYFKRNRLKKTDSTRTAIVEYLNGGTTATQNTSITQTTHTSDESDIVGLPCEVYFLKNKVLTRWSGTVSSYSGEETSVPSNSDTETYIFVGAYPVTTTVRNIAIAVSTTQVVPFCPYPVADNQYTLVVNPTFSLVSGGIDAPLAFRNGCLSAEFGSIKSGTGDILATAYVCGKALYRAGKTNYAAVWDFAKQPDGKCKIVKREALKRGSTKPNTGVSGETAIAVQYFG